MPYVRYTSLRHSTAILCSTVLILMLGAFNDEVADSNNGGAQDTGIDAVDDAVDPDAEDADTSDASDADTADTTDTDDTADTCAPLSSCGNACVDTDTSTQHCGACDNPCDDGQTCESGVCEYPPGDCRGEPCTGQTYCDTSTGQCLDGCAEDEQCGDQQVCDTDNNACVCASGFHDCGGECVPDDSPASCGSRCIPCAQSANADDVCQAGGTCAQTFSDRELAAGYLHNVARVPSGTLYGWGRDEDEQASPPTL